ncbi:MAG: hypothetical protein ABL909_05485 [Sphingopyxis sp.]
MANRFATKARAAMVVLLAGSTLATAIPANAQYYGRRDHDRHGRHDGISAGDVIAGAIVIGGLAAILSSGGNRDRNRDRNYDPRYDRGHDNRYDGYDWDRNGGSREAIERCVAAVERRSGRGNDVDVQRITNIDRIRGGYQIAGNVAVDYRGRGGDWRDRDRYGERDRDGYGRGYDRDYDRDGNNRGWGRGDRHRYDDRGRFTCTVRYGRVEDVDFRGLT